MCFLALGNSDFKLKISETDTSVALIFFFQIKFRLVLMKYISNRHLNLDC